MNDPTNTESTSDPAALGDRSLTKTLVLMIAIPGLVAMALWIFIIIKDARDRAAIGTFPFTTQVHAESDGDLYADVRYYQYGGYSIVDIADTRLAFAGKSAKIVFLGMVTIRSIKPDGKSGSVSGGKPGGKISSFSAEYKAGQATVKLDGTLLFVVRDSTILVGDKAIGIGKGPSCTFVDKHGVIGPVGRVPQ